MMLLPLDVTRDDQRRAVIAKVAERWGGVDVLVNNAGVSFRSVSEHVTEAESAFELLRRCLPSSLYSRLLYAGLPRIWEWGPRTRRSKDEA